MSRTPISMTIPDVSVFARSLRASFKDGPSHQEMLSHIARAAGYRNFQHLKARLSETAPDLPDTRMVDRAVRYFDSAGRFSDWPAKTRVQALCLWGLWARLPARQEMTEREVSHRLDHLCAFRDAAQIRRSLVEHGLVSRTKDGAVYLRIERRPSPEARELITRLHGRSA